MGGVGFRDDTVPGVALRDDLCLAAVGLFFARSFSIFCLMPSSFLLWRFLRSLVSSGLGMALGLLA